jgi:DNA-binding transcriptional LysR family regulator
MRGTQFAELNAFVAVADQGSFTKAGRLLGLSTATLSQTLRALEHRLGVRLLNRTTRSVALAGRGGQAHKFAREICIANHGRLFFILSKPSAESSSAARTH